MLHLCSQMYSAAAKIAARVCVCCNILINVRAIWESDVDILKYSGHFQHFPCDFLLSVRALAAFSINCVILRHSRHCCRHKLSMKCRFKSALAICIDEQHFGLDRATIKCLKCCVWPLRLLEMGEKRIGWMLLCENRSQFRCIRSYIFCNVGIIASAWKNIFRNFRE